MPKQVETERDGVINTHNFIFNQFKHMVFPPTVADRRTWLHVPSGTHWSTSRVTHQVVKIQNRDFCLERWKKIMDISNVSSVFRTESVSDCRYEMINDGIDWDEKQITVSCVQNHGKVV